MEGEKIPNRDVSRGVLPKILLPASLGSAVPHTRLLPSKKPLAFESKSMHLLAPAYELPTYVSNRPQLDPSPSHRIVHP